MSGLIFTDEAARHLEKTYRTKDIVAQRRETIRHLNLSAGEKVLDIGPIEATAEKHKSIPLPPLFGGVALAGGVVLLVAGSKKR